MESLLTHKLRRSSNRFARRGFQYFLTYDPAMALRKVTCPVLVLNGEKDKQVIPGQNLPGDSQGFGGRRQSAL